MKKAITILQMTEFANNANQGLMVKKISIAVHVPQHELALTILFSNNLF
jgi:hypothetical protein